MEEMETQQRDTDDSVESDKHSRQITRPPLVGGFHRVNKMAVVVGLALLSIHVCGATSDHVTRSPVIEEQRMLLEDPTWDLFWKTPAIRSRFLSDNDDEDDDEDEEEERDKWHPGKEGYDCDHYYAIRNDTFDGAGYQNWQANGGRPVGNGNGRPFFNGGNRQLGYRRGNDDYLPCREAPPPSGFGNGDRPPANGNGPPGVGNGNIPPPPDFSDEELEASTVKLNISLAIPNTHTNGIPSVLTTTIKNYFREKDVTLSFLELEYKGEYHFLLDVWKPSDNARIESDSEDEHHDDNNNNRRRLPTVDVSQTAHPNATTLGLVALRDKVGHLIQEVEHTKYAWYHHTVFLVAHGQAPNTTNSTTYDGQQLVQDEELMAWLDVQLKEMVYRDIYLQGPLGPYYDSNNYGGDQNCNNNKKRRISYMEWSIQSYGIPIAGVAKPGEEDLELTDHRDYYDSCTENIPSPAPWVDPTIPEPIEEREALDRHYMGIRQWMGLSCLLGTVVFTTILVIISNEVAKRREQDELWGNLNILETAQEDADYLNVGWRFDKTGGGQVDDGDEKPENNNIPANMMMMEVFDKRGVGYREGDSLLMGGYEYKPSVRFDASVADASALHKTNSYKVDPSVTPFG